MAGGRGRGLFVSADWRPLKTHSKALVKNQIKGFSPISPVGEKQRKEHKSVKQIMFLENAKAERRTA